MQGTWLIANPFVRINEPLQNSVAIRVDSLLLCDLRIQYTAYYVTVALSQLYRGGATERDKYPFQAASHFSIFDRHACLVCAEGSFVPIGRRGNSFLYAAMD